MKLDRGFTLIELLMSVAIIAILSAVVLGGLDTARSKARDSKVKSQLNSVRTAAQSYYTTHGDFTYAATCSAGMFIVTEFGMSHLINLNNYPPNTNIRCMANGQSYAVSANLTGENRFWCVDPSGSKELSSDPGSVTACP